MWGNSRLGTKRDHDCQYCRPGSEAVSSFGILVAHLLPDQDSGAWSACMTYLALSILAIRGASESRLVPTALSDQTIHRQNQARCKPLRRHIGCAVDMESGRDGLLQQIDECLGLDVGQNIIRSLNM